MLKGVRAEFYAASSRDPAIYRGRPFQIEAAIAFGGDLPADDSARVIRFANRVPLLYQQSACSSFKAVVETSWRNYNLQQPKGSLPVGPLVIMIHMASVWVPFTSESKEAIADYDEIRKEMKLALMECGRKLGTYLRKRQAMRREAERRDIFERYIGEIAQAVNAINGTDAKKLYEALLSQAKKRTAIADVELDEEGKVVKDEEALREDDGVIIVQSAAMGDSDAPAADALPGKLSKAEAAMLKVHATRDDDEPLLLETKEVGRSSRTGKPGKKRVAPKPPAKGKTAKARSPEPPRETPPSPPSQPRPPKPRLRLVGDKLVRADQGPALF
jgi:DNA topoisomerase-6 subunit B